MKKLMILIFALLLIICSVGVHGLLTDPLTYFSCDNATVVGANLQDLTGNSYNGTLNTPVSVGDGILVDAIDFEDGDPDRVDTDANFVVDLKDDTEGTICIWVKPEAFNVAHAIYSFFWDADNEGMIYIFNDGTVYNGWDTPGGNPSLQTAIGLVVVGKYTHICHVGNTTHQIIYVNGTNENQTRTALWFNNAADMNDFDFGREIDGNKFHYDGIMDEIAVYSRGLTPTEISDLYNGGVGVNPCSGGACLGLHDYINLSSPLPINNSNFTVSTINFNTTANSTYNFNCSLYINSTFNETIPGYTAGTNVFINFTKTMADGSWNYNISCVQFNDTTQNETTVTNNIYVDVTNPVITDDFINNSVYFIAHIDFSLNLSDNLNLNSYNVSVDGTSIQGNNSIGESTLNVTVDYDPHLLADGFHNLTIRVADGHTAKELRYKDSWDWTNGLFNDYLKYEWDSPYRECEVTIKQKGGSIFDSWDTEEGFDRFTFTFKPNILSNIYTFEVESNCGYNILSNPNSKYKTWLTISEHWLDFYLDGTEQIIITPITNKEVEVTISNLDPTQEIFYFNSLGDLNEVTKHYVFIKATGDVIYQQVVSEKEIQTILFNISKPTGVIATNATFEYNGTRIGVTNTSTTAYDLYNATFNAPNITAQSILFNFSWFYNISTAVNSEIGNTTDNQTVTQIGIDNCSTYSMRAVNITIRRDDTGAESWTDVGGYFEVWVNDINNFRAFNLTWTNITNGSICIFPNSSNYTIYTQFEYGGNQIGSTTFNLETHYLINYTLDNETDLLDFYMTPNATLVTFTVTDQDDNTVQNVFIHVLRYDFPTNSHITTEIIETDEQGEALGSIILNTEWYKFLLIYRGNLVLETDPVKITGTERNFRINLQTNFYDFFDTFNNIQHSLTFTNATRNFAYTFVNTLGTSVTGCLNVQERHGATETLINETCVTVASATILVNIGNATAVAGNTYVAVGTIEVNPVDITDILSVSFARGFRQWGRDGILATFLVRMSLSMVGIWNPMVAIILLILADIGMISIGLYHMNWTTLIFYIILAGIAIYRVNRRG